MYRVVAYLDSKEKHDLLELAYRRGYIRETQRGGYGHRIKQHNIGMTLFLTDLFRTPLIADDVLYMGKPLHSPNNKVTATVALLLADLPEFYGLENWDQLLTNIAQGRIRPEPPHDYPRTDIDILAREAHESKGMNYVLYTTGRTIKYLMERDDGRGEDDNPFINILAPQSYVDNRPQPPQDEPITLPPASKLVTLSYDYWWYLPGMDRRMATLRLTDHDVEALQAIQQYWHILPYKRRTQPAMLATTLEALSHKLLVPATTPTDELDNYQ